MRLGDGDAVGWAAGVGPMPPAWGHGKVGVSPAESSNVAQRGTCHRAGLINAEHQPRCVAASRRTMHTLLRHMEIFTLQHHTHQTWQLALGDRAVGRPPHVLGREPWWGELS